MENVESFLSALPSGNSIQSDSLLKMQDLWPALCRKETTGSEGRGEGLGRHNELGLQAGFDASLLDACL